MKIYTSTVSADKSISLIERALARAGANHISKTYSRESVDGFYFQLTVSDRPISFKLPVDTIAVRRVFEARISKPHKGTMNRIREQAERTAWKILLDWVEIQLSMIEMEQAKAIQIFLPYVFDGEQTFFQRLEGSGFKQLEAGK